MSDDLFARIQITREGDGQSKLNIFVEESEVHSMVATGDPAECCFQCVTDDDRGKIFQEVCFDIRDASVIGEMFLELAELAFKRYGV